MANNVACNVLISMKNKKEQNLSDLLNEYIYYSLLLYNIINHSVIFLNKKSF